MHPTPYCKVSWTIELDRNKFGHPPTSQLKNCGLQSELSLLAQWTTLLSAENFSAFVQLQLYQWGNIHISNTYFPRIHRRIQLCKLFLIALIFLNFKVQRWSLECWLKWYTLQSSGSGCHSIIIHEWQLTVTLMLIGALYGTECQLHRVM